MGETTEPNPTCEASPGTIDPERTDPIESCSEAHILEVKEAHAEASARSRTGYAIPLERVRQPGAYVSVATGRLIRVRRWALGDDGPIPGVVGSAGDETVVFLSSDPEAPRTQLRFASVSANVRPGF